MVKFVYNLVESDFDNAGPGLLKLCDLPAFRGACAFELVEFFLGDAKKNALTATKDAFKGQMASAKGKIDTEDAQVKLGNALYEHINNWIDPKKKGKGKGKGKGGPDPLSLSLSEEDGMGVDKALWTQNLAGRFFPGYMKIW